MSPSLLLLLLTGRLKEVRLSTNLIFSSLHPLYLYTFVVVPYNLTSSLSNQSLSFSNTIQSLSKSR